MDAAGAVAVAARHTTEDAQEYPGKGAGDSLNFADLLQHRLARGLIVVDTAFEPHELMSSVCYRSPWGGYHTLVRVPVKLWDQIEAEGGRRVAEQYRFRTRVSDGEFALLNEAEQVLVQREGGRA